MIVAILAAIVIGFIMGLMTGIKIPKKSLDRIISRLGKLK